MDVKHCIKLALESIGIEELKEKQEEAVLAFLSNRDVFVSLPTDYVFKVSNDLNIKCTYVS